MAQTRAVFKQQIGPHEVSIIAIDKFIQSTRDSGYKDTGSAVAELVDNSLQAGASVIKITVATTSGGAQGDVRVAVTDNGRGMAAETLVQAMRFGGSTRFDDRSGLGRFGMGLPNASLSQAKRLTVYTWQDKGKPIATYLDVDEIVAGEMSQVPAPQRKDLPEWLGDAVGESGTVIVWEKCDRIDFRRVSTVFRRLNQTLGQTFRYFIWGGTKIRVNDTAVKPIDPLFLTDGYQKAEATAFGETIELEVAASDTAVVAGTGKVEIRFSELPVSQWHDLGNDKKRELGISNRAGVSIVRAGREVDYGWLFMGDKRRENYDDWWRCEVRFDPVLDEAFGITHTKQQIRPKPHLTEALQPYIEAAAKALNGRVRQTFVQIKSSATARTAEAIAETQQVALTPLKRSNITTGDKAALERLVRRNPLLRGEIKTDPKRGVSYKLVEDDLGDACLYRPIFSEGTIISVLNPRHAFARKVYQPLLDGRNPEAKAVLEALQLLLLAASRAEVSLGPKERKVIGKFRKEWSETLEVMLR